MLCLFFFFKQKTAYELRISDWSSDVCSSDLLYGHQPTLGTSDAAAAFGRRTPASRPSSCRMPLASTSIERCILARPCPDRDAAALAQQPQQDAERLASCPEPAPLGGVAEEVGGTGEAAIGGEVGEAHQGVRRSEEQTSELQSLMRIS